jgi:hypothetical protein
MTVIRNTCSRKFARANYAAGTRSASATKAKLTPKSHILDAVHDTGRGLFAGIARRPMNIASQAMHRQEARYTRVWACSNIGNLQALVC